MIGGRNSKGIVGWDLLSSQSELFTVLFMLVTSIDTRGWRDTHCCIVLLLFVGVLARSTQNFSSQKLLHQQFTVAQL